MKRKKVTPAEAAEPAALIPTDAGNPAELRGLAASLLRPPDPVGFVAEPFILERVPVCRRTLGTWRENGRIPFIKLGNRILYHWSSVEAALLRLQK